MAEFFQTMKSYSEVPLKERVDGLADVIEKIMSITLKIPEMTDVSIQNLLSQIDGLNTRISKLETLSARISALEGKMANLQSGPIVGAPVASASAPPPPPPGGGPGAPPGAPPPPPGRAPAAPANPVSLRGSIMDELKSLFSKRRSASEDDDDDDDDE